MTLSRCPAVVVEAIGPTSKPRYVDTPTRNALLRKPLPPSGPDQLECRGGRLAPTRKETEDQRHLRADASQSDLDVAREDGDPTTSQGDIGQKDKRSNGGRALTLELSPNAQAHPCL